MKRVQLAGMDMLWPWTGCWLHRASGLMIATTKGKTRRAKISKRRNKAATINSTTRPRRTTRKRNIGAWSTPRWA